MEEFKSLNWLRSGIRYVLEVLAALSFLLLTIGLVSASWNFLDKDALFGNAPQLQSLWALDQALAIDANLPLTFVALYGAVKRKSWGIVAVYVVIGVMLLFVAAVILGTESLRQALDISLGQAALEIHVPVEVLTLMRSGATIGLVAMSGLNLTVLHVVQKEPVQVPPEPEPVQLAPPSPAPIAPSSKAKSNGHARDGYQRYLEYLTISTKEEQTIPRLAKALGVAPSTINNYRKRQRKDDDELKVLVPTHTDDSEGGNG